MQQILIYFSSNLLDIEKNTLTSAIKLHDCQCAGAFRVEMQRESQKDRIIDCRYDPTEPGEYEVSVKWSGVDVPGSPFRVRIFNVKEQLEQFYARYPKQHSRPIGVAQHPVMGTANGSHNASFIGEE